MCVPIMLYETSSLNRTFHLELRQSKLNRGLCGMHRGGVG